MGAASSANPTPRPPLAFFESRAMDVADLPALQRRVSESLPLRALFEPSHGGDFFHRSGATRLAGLPITCSLHSSLEVAFDDGCFATLVLPCSGSARVHLEGLTLDLAAGPMAAYLPGCAFKATTGLFEEVMISLDRSRLAATAAVLGPGPARPQAPQLARFEGELLVDGAAEPLQAELLRHLRLALQMAEAPLLKSVGGVEPEQIADLIYRLVAAMLCPERILEASTGPGTAGIGPTTRRDRHFEELLAWVQAHLHTPLTPTLLSRRSTYSLRTLYYMFQKRFGCSPMQWVKQQRLSAVRCDLQRAHPGESVALIAARHGFRHASAFAASFKQRYGECPSGVLRGSPRPDQAAAPALGDN